MKSFLSVWDTGGLRVDTRSPLNLASKSFSNVAVCSFAENISLAAQKSIFPKKHRYKRTAVVTIQSGQITKEP